ncbi:hypothetical protein FY192_00100 [Anaplasma marginale]|uniref:hypothetical protein n=1 Tax=Anaplasma marginale TaxID=770 RepID=UPI00124626BC|nr:hypothetical protein [Anaplasma marginale]KAB0453302.1 hypothetical protein FY192_00100 [Anaplasma marginale]
MASGRVFSAFKIDSRAARSSVGGVGEVRGGVECCVLLISSVVFFLLVYGLVVARVDSSGKLAVGIMGCALVAFLASALIILPVMALKDLGHDGNNRPYGHLALYCEVDNRSRPSKVVDNTDPCCKRVTYKVVVLCALVAALAIGAILYALSDATAAHFAVVVMIFIVASLPAVTMLMCDDVAEHEGGRLHAICALAEGGPPEMSVLALHNCEPAPATLVSGSKVAVEVAVAAGSTDSQSRSVR